MRPTLGMSIFVFIAVLRVDLQRPHLKMSEGNFANGLRKKISDYQIFQKKEETRIVHDFHKIKNENKIVDDIIEFMN